MQEVISHDNSILRTEKGSIPAEALSFGQVAGPCGAKIPKAMLVVSGADGSKLHMSFDQQEFLNVIAVAQKIYDDVFKTQS